MTAQGRLNLSKLDGLAFTRGKHSRPEAGVCAVEAWALVRGWEFSDEPALAPATIAAFMRRWNDDIPNVSARTRLLRPLVAELAAQDLDLSAEAEAQRAWLAADWLVRECAPTWLDLTEALRPHAGVLRALAPIASKDAARSCLHALRAAAHDAWYKAGSYGGSVARAAAWYVARNFAISAAGAAACHAAGAAAGADAGDVARCVAESAAGAAAGAAAGVDREPGAGAAPTPVRRAVEVGLRPTVARLQASAADLVRRMAAVRVNTTVAAAEGQ